MLRRSCAFALLLLSSPSPAMANGNYAEKTWHGGEVGVDICYNDRGMGFRRPNWRFTSAPAVPCFSQ